MAQRVRPSDFAQVPLVEAIQERNDAIEALHRSNRDLLALGGCPWWPQDISDERLAEMSVPALLLAGAEDTKFATIADEMAMAMPSARRQLVADAGHAE